MAVQIYNEGRIVGYSAYEIYVKQHLSEDPNTPVASEREWLASSLAMGASMLLKLPSKELANEDTHGYIDIPLPEDCVLAAANTIIGSFFDGDAEFNGNWATKVTDYGQCISNNASSSPNGNISAASVRTSYPRQTLKDWTQAQKKKLRDYMKIVDGVVLQPGNWFANTSVPPTKDFSADLKGAAYPTVRIHIKGSITQNPLILLTGFTVRSVLLGTVGTSTAVNTRSPKDGDFLGPSTFPWANKIVFSVPTSYIVYFESGAYKRRITPTNVSGLDGDPSDIRVSDTPVIDMKSGSGDRVIAGTVLENYYDAKFQNAGAAATYARNIAYLYEDFIHVMRDSSGNIIRDENGDPVLSDPPSDVYAWVKAKLNGGRVDDNVKDFTTLGDGTSVLTVYQKRYVYPPALYGTFVDSVGKEYLHPIDVVAPGTVKMFHNAGSGTMKEFQDTFPGTNSMNKTPEGTVEVLDDQGNVVPIADLDTGITICDPSQAIDGKVPKIADKRHIRFKPGTADVETNFDEYHGPGSEVARRLGISAGTKREETFSIRGLKMDTKPGEMGRPGDPGVPDSLLVDDTNSSDNITWAALVNALANNKGLDLLGSRLKSLKNNLIRPMTSEPRDDNNRDSTGAPYIEFGPNDGTTIRLYISTVQPDVSDVPIGSIGIGWGFEYEE